MKKTIKEELGIKERYFYGDDKKGGKNVDKEINELSERIMSDFHSILSMMDTEFYYEELRSISKKLNEKYFYGDDENDDDDYSYEKNTSPITLELVKKTIKGHLGINEKYFYEDDKKGSKNVDKEINELAKNIMSDFHDTLEMIPDRDMYSKQFNKIENMM